MAILIGSWGRTRTCKPCGRLINSQVRLPFRHPGMKLVPGVCFEQTSSRLQRDAFTRLAFQAMMARTLQSASDYPKTASHFSVRCCGIEPLSPEGHSEAQPIDQIRVAGVGIEPTLPFGVSV